MKAIMLMFDTLNRHYLPGYGCDWVHAPNFQRLAERSVTFDNCYVGSMPCMPARRELHTGRYNFLHRSWGPLEPYDDSAIEIMSANGVYTHLATDHQHYWEDGGATYHFRYSSFDFIRGQEGDPYIGDVAAMKGVDKINAAAGAFKKRADALNRTYMQNEKDMPLARTIEAGLAFMERNQGQDSWFLQLECFDPHEPFFVPQRFKALYEECSNGETYDWPAYGRAEMSAKERDKIRKTYASLLSMCDEYLGRVLDMMDRHDMWKDTMLIVNTDHGYLLDEHDYWGKNVMPWYNETALIPLFIWDPRCQKAGERRQSLVQTIDLPATLLDYFGLNIPADMQGRPLRGVLETDETIHDAALFGVYGGHVCVTDGRHVYMRGIGEGDNTPLYQYTYMPTHLYNLFSVREMQTAELAQPFAFTKNCRLMKIQAAQWLDKDTHARAGFPQVQQLEQSLLFDVKEDPGQLRPLKDSVLEAQMLEKMIALMKETDAPVEQYQRLGIAGEN